MEKENKMDLNENRIVNQGDGVELSDKALEDAAGAGFVVAKRAGYVCDRCGRTYEGVPSFVQDGEVLKSVCYPCYKEYYEHPSPNTSNIFR